MFPGRGDEIPAAAAGAGLSSGHSVKMLVTAQVEDAVIGADCVTTDWAPAGGCGLNKADLLLYPDPQARLSSPQSRGGEMPGRAPLPAPQRANKMHIFLQERPH